MQTASMKCNRNRIQRYSTVVRCNWLWDDADGFIVIHHENEWIIISQNEVHSDPQRQLHLSCMRYMMLSTIPNELNWASLWLVNIIIQEITKTRMTNRKNSEHIENTRSSILSADTYLESKICATHSVCCRVQRSLAAAFRLNDELSILLFVDC